MLNDVGKTAELTEFNTIELLNKIQNYYCSLIKSFIPKNSKIILFIINHRPNKEK